MAVVLEEEDLPFEEDILRNPSSIRPWLRYIEHKKSTSRVNLIFERALKELPGSYKLWYAYLTLRQKHTIKRVPTDPQYEVLNNAYERALVFMHKMPRIWIQYAEFLYKYQRKVTRTRRVLDRALRALPVTQHDRIWPIYTAFIESHGEALKETGIRVYRRYMQLSPEGAVEDFIDYLIRVKKLDDGSVLLTRLVNGNDRAFSEFVSKRGKSNYALWNDLCKLISENPSEIKSLNVDAIIRSGLRRYTDQVGHLWCSLADYYIRSGLFERARDVYEESVRSVTTVRDFSQVFDAYSQFQELMLSKMMEEMKVASSSTEKVDENSLELAFARFDDLIERRPLLLNSVLLRQNPHNVPEWLKRVSLYEGKPKEIVKTYTEAVKTVDPKQAVGKLYLLWNNFAKFYEEKKQLSDARIIFEKATQVSFLKVEDLAHVWTEWVEMELRNDKYNEALGLVRKAVSPPKRRVSYHDTSETVQARLHKSLKVWSLYADLEESFGSFQSTKAVYDRILDLKIATPQIVINYGLFLKEHNYFEEAFKAYEKGIALFKWPNVYDIWNTYLTEFLERYGGKKLERTRDLFEQCLESCPQDYAKNIYILYAKLEEQHGMARHAMAVYDRAIQSVTKKERFSLYNIYLKKASEIYGVTRTRQIYEKAIEVLEDKEAREMCVRFAELETKLGEVDRARVIFSHCSQMCDPRTSTEFWSKWKDFEVKHGNEDTLREMLRIKRSVQHTYNTQVNMMSAQMTAVNTLSDSKDEMKILEKKVMGESNVSAHEILSAPKTSSIAFIRGETQSDSLEKGLESTNPDEIDIDEEDEEEEGNMGDKVSIGKVEEQVIPSEVFGGLNNERDTD
uniref:Uncharacterized protein n=2 Tax=Lepeophtheirus salmonis TaxID=72036 RepID=A0A0K2TS77_LEPSM